MTRITEAQQAPQHLATLRQWYTNEWGKDYSFAVNHPGYIVPEPLLALDEGNELLGGLAFSTFDWPEDGDTGVWINAVYVHPDSRGKQIASQLISRAERCAANAQIELLFVYTQMPALYTKLGWRLMGQTGTDCVLSKKVKATAAD